MTKTTEIDEQIGDNIKLFRLMQNRGRRWLGDKIGISYHQVQNYEIGRHRVSASTLYEISKLLKTPIHKFFPEK